MTTPINITLEEHLTDLATVIAMIDPEGMTIARWHETTEAIEGAFWEAWQKIGKDLLDELLEGVPDFDGTTWTLSNGETFTVPHHE